MDRKPLKIGDLTARIPVIQGGMGVGISLSHLAGSVAANGGVGILSAAQIGFREPDFEEHPKEVDRSGSRAGTEEKSGNDCRKHERTYALFPGKTGRKKRRSACHRTLRAFSQVLDV